MIRSTPASTPKADLLEIRRTLDLLLEADQVAELRVLNTRQRTTSGYFMDFDKLAVAAASMSGKAPGIYVTLNPVCPDLLARAANRLKGFSQETTSDNQIVRRRWLPIDFDPLHPSGISSTDAEHQLALTKAELVGRWLTGQGWPEPVYADSGNGAHLAYRVDLPNDSEATNLLRNCLGALAFRFDDGQVTVDTGNFNAARIWKLYGTLACKGDSIPARPHRLSRILDAPKRQEIVSLPVLLN